MELAVAVVVIVAIALWALVRVGGDPSRSMSGMWRFRVPGWPSGVQEDDDLHWSWAKTAPKTVDDATRDRPDPADEGLTVDVAPVGYEVRSADRARS